MSVVAPHFVRTTDRLFITFYDTGAGQQALIWLDQAGNVLHTESPEYYDIQYAYGDSSDIVLLQYQPRMEETLSWHVLRALRYNSGYELTAYDTLLADTIARDGIFAGTTYEVRDGNLTAALITASGVQYPEDYMVNIVRYSGGSVTNYTPWRLGTPAYQGYFYWFDVSSTESGGGVLGFYAYGDAGSQLRFRAFDPSGYPTEETHVQPTSAEQNIMGLEIRVFGGEVYADYVATSSMNADVRGCYFLGFPLDEILEAETPRAEIPTAFQLSAYPNPFNGSARIDYTLPRAGEFSLTVYDVTGREVSRLLGGKQAAGAHTLIWSADNLPTGLYFIHGEANSFRMTTKAALIR